MIVTHTGVTTCLPHKPIWTYYYHSFVGNRPFFPKLGRNYYPPHLLVVCIAFCYTDWSMMSAQTRTERRIEGARDESSRLVRRESGDSTRRGRRTVMISDYGSCYRFSMV